MTEPVDGGYAPKHLTEKHLQALYTEDLLQAEAQVRAAWISVKNAQIEYEAALRRLEMIESERQRTQKTALGET